MALMPKGCSSLLASISTISSFGFSAIPQAAWNI
ncbi:hypothetical protein CCACVL1_21694 [Corchorus capsularis]|uniref:Uncharacterized protein n=1 Tax=Corchorus capsularis TaxID=210143 RepID=A0A1R3H2D3_COCAP|nr:hypothetical protein CCACVL1_21694 [Corchorus capsularis]